MATVRETGGITLHSVIRTYTLTTFATVHSVCLQPFLKNAILAHVKVGKDKICQIPIQYNFQTRGLDWKAQDKECYDLYGYAPLPSIYDIWSMVEDNNNQYFLPYTNGMDGFKKSRIGTGVPVRDKAEAYKRFLNLLSDYIDKPGNPSRISRQQKLQCYKSPKDYATQEDFREWVASCAETKHIRFELYGMLDNCTHSALLDEVCKKIYEDFGEGNEGSCITIEVVKKEIGDIADAIENKYDKPMRCDEIREKLDIKIHEMKYPGCFFPYSRIQTPST